jgi:hypothetical protein
MKPTTILLAAIAGATLAALRNEDKLNARYARLERRIDRINTAQAGHHTRP